MAVSPVYFEQHRLTVSDRYCVQQAALQPSVTLVSTAKMTRHSEQHAHTQYHGGFRSKVPKIQSPHVPSGSVSGTHQPSGHLDTSRRTVPLLDRISESTHLQIVRVWRPERVQADCGEHARSADLCWPAVRVSDRQCSAAQERRAELVDLCSLNGAMSCRAAY
jgi:hypothetical protein